MVPSQRDDRLPGPIRGINRTSLWRSWKAVRKELKNSSIRDVVDFLDFDVNPNVWINRLLARVASGEYEPEVARRFTLGKSLGFSRVMTLPAIPDLVLYRTIVEHIYGRSQRRRHRNVYFLRDELTKVQKRAFDDALGRMRGAPDLHATGDRYRLVGTRSFYNWLKFNQYRKYLIFEKVYNFIIVTDIANFFDTILHSHVAEAVQGSPVSSRMTGLLFFLLERLSVRQDYTSSHGISLPIDEFDCSRTLAHMVLYSHDDAIVKVVGEEAYVRWMDDQSIGAATRAEGLRLLGEVGRSLERLHLTPSTQKSKVLTLSEARRHFHLDLNEQLDQGELLAKKADARKTARLRFERKVRGIWRKAQRYRGTGEFSKILRRLYRLAGLARLGFLRARAAQDILEDPSLVERIAGYYRCTGTVSEYVDFVDGLMNNPEQVYPDVNVALIESLLRAEPIGSDVVRLRQLTKSLIRRDGSLPGADDCAATATLLALRFGDGSVRSLLERCFKDTRQVVPRQVVRAAAFVYSSDSLEAYKKVREVASVTLRNHLSTLVRLIAEIRKYKDVPPRYRGRFGLSLDSVAGRRFVDTRVILTARLLLLSPERAVRGWVIGWCKQVLREGISDYDRRLLTRLVLAPRHGVPYRTGPRKVSR